MKRLRSFIIGAVLFLAGGAVANNAVPYFTGPQDPASLFAYLNQIESQVGYIMFNQTVAETGEMAFAAGTCYSGTSICVVLPTGTVRYIQTSATP